MALKLDTRITPRVAYGESLDRKNFPTPEFNFALMPRAKFLEWLEASNRVAKPIPQLIEEYRRSSYEDNESSFSK